MSARMFIGLMLILTVFTAGLSVYPTAKQQKVETNECPAGTALSDDTETMATDGMMWESVSKHLLNVIQ